MQSFIFQAQHPHSKRIVQQTLAARDRSAALAAFRQYLFTDGFADYSDSVRVFDVHQSEDSAMLEDTKPAVHGTSRVVLEDWLVSRGWERPGTALRYPESQGGFRVTLSDADLRLMAAIDRKERCKRKRRLRVHPMGWELRGKHCSAVGRTPEEAWRLYSQLRQELRENAGRTRPLPELPERVTRHPVPLVWDVPVKRRPGLLLRVLTMCMDAVPLFRVTRPMQRYPLHMVWPTNGTEPRPR